ncbi:TRAP-type C4-dicarboxylate transport system permease small subunit [Geomicrobium halophilum]|uniref:TRAP-type C4-dicarboxylate transport system permease small subunit n=1 Tax=Geomicrobium halophilum TaxID=549000 RepID=A0A841PIR6_9BACL|nr:TRAP transporter small permease [Geomicrobium halophilum]MBB6448629.1 TRAP-type C4-dicarboxylate transport system permease small subunit [Geomicrobium halophilum]
MKILRWLDKHLEEYILVFLSALATVVVLYNVFMRFVMNDSSSWAEELARFSFIWLILVGISYGVKTQRHISVDALLMAFKAKGKVIINIIANVLFLIFAITMVYFGYDVASTTLDRGQVTPGLQIPMGVVYLAAPVGMFLTSIRLIQHIWGQISRLKTGDFEDVEEEFSEQMKQ